MRDKLSPWSLFFHTFWVTKRKSQFGYFGCQRENFWKYLNIKKTYSNYLKITFCNYNFLSQWTTWESVKKYFFLVHLKIVWINFALEDSSAGKRTIHEQIRLIIKWVGKSNLLWNTNCFEFYLVCYFFPIFWVPQPFCPSPSQVQSSVFPSSCLKTFKRSLSIDGYSKVSLRHVFFNTCPSFLFGQYPISIIQWAFIHVGVSWIFFVFIFH